MKKRSEKGRINGRIILLFCLFAVVIAAALGVLAGCVNSTNPYLETLDIKMTLNADGSANITETHVVVFSDRGSNWWNYYKTISLYDIECNGNNRSGFSDFTCTVDGVDYPYSNDQLNLNGNVSESVKRSAAGSAYTYKTSNDIEIGVVMEGFTSGRRTIVFNYTLTNVMISYADCAGLYYKFVDESNTLYIEKLTAEVNFAPVSVDDVNLWTHIDDGNGEGVLPDGTTVSKASYTAEGLSDGTYFETRLLLPAEGYEIGKTNGATRAKIIAQETQWQEEYVAELRRIKTQYIVDIVLFCLFVIGTLPLCLYIRKKRRPLKLDDAPIYLREIPSGWTAGEMAPLYHYYGKYEVSDAISATMLDLCRRHYIDISAGDKKKSAEITVRNMDISALAPHEKIVIEMLKKTGNGQPFTMKDMEKYASRNYSYYSTQINNFNSAAKGLSEGMGCYPKGFDKTAGLFNNISIVLFALGALLLINTFVTRFFGLQLPLAGVGLIIMGILIRVVISKQKSPLTEKGQRAYDKFQALGKFMLEFSNMKDHELPQLILWEEYMVYATAMGIADKVAEQLEIAYPEYREMVRNGYPSNSNGFLILYLLSPSLRHVTNFAFAATIRGITGNVMQLNRSAKMAANAKKFGSSVVGSRGGGGFRGGGGGFGGGGMGAR